jgi:hypothetical protein
MAAGSNQLPLCASFEFVDIGQGEEGVGGGGGAMAPLITMPLMRCKVCSNKSNFCAGKCEAELNGGFVADVGDE